MPKLLKKQPEKKTEREKVEERREEVLARGRKFKYPLQYAKHRLVFVTIIVAVVAVGLLIGAGYVALYKAQSESNVLYRLTQIAPIPVAKVDGEDVRYSDYLMIYRSSIAPVEQQQGKLGDDEDSETMRAHYKRLALTEAEKYTYAEKLARELGVEVTDEMVDEALKENRNVGGTERSEEAFKKILQDNFGLSEREYRRMLYLSLVQREVSVAVDKEAEATAKLVESRLNGEVNFNELASELGDKVVYEETGGLVDKMNVDGGRAAAAAKLEPGQVSKRFVSANGDGFYFVKLIEKTDSSVNYASIKVPFTEFLKKFEGLGDAIQEYIELAAQEEAVSE